MQGSLWNPHDIVLVIEHCPINPVYFTGIEEEMEIRKHYVALLVLTGMLFVGCSNTSTTDVSDQTKAGSEFLTLEQAQQKVPFKILVPKDLPQGLKFDRAMLDVNPNDNKVIGVHLTFQSADEKTFLQIDEKQGDAVPGIVGDIVKELDVNGRKARYAQDKTHASLLGRTVKCHL